MEPASEGGRTQYQDARDGTLYWTLSFYLPARLVGPQRPESAVGDDTRHLREAIEPLFNDIADRSSWEGKVDDRMFAAAPAEQLRLRMPAHVCWSTEGRRFRVAVPEPLRERNVGLRRFWYQHGNGAISWHLSFDYFYGDDLANETGTPGHPALTYYFMSLLQKLAWPKEFRRGEGMPSTDALVGIEARPPGSEGTDSADWQGFWTFVEALFRRDCRRRLDMICMRDKAGDPTADLSPPAAIEAPPPGSEGTDSADWQGFWTFVEALFRRNCRRRLDMVCMRDEARNPTADLSPPAALVEFIEHLLKENRRPSIEIPGLDHHECRSLFFVHDPTLFNLIQPVDKDTRALVKRRERVRDPDYQRYPAHIRDNALVEHGSDPDGGRTTLLGDKYWETVRPAGDQEAESRLAYLFLAGFNQNIIDFMNQEASEVLDSLDPIYPKSDDQEEEGFFIRYANPRSMITYVKRSRTLEVGNDWIGTCPYAFLIHALAMHNEALTRAQEKDTFLTIARIQGRIGKGEYEEAEKSINTIRIRAFEVYERHRYHNPFRYDTERDVFDSLEQLRGTSRRRKAYEMGLASLEEKNRDLTRVREQNEDAKQRRREFGLAVLFGLLGVSGVIQVLYQWHLFTFGEPSRPLKWIEIAAEAAYVIMPILLAVVLLWRWMRKEPATDRTRVD